MGPDFPKRLRKAVASIGKKIDFQPTLAIIAGTGLNSLLVDIEIEKTIPYSKIHGFPVSTAPGHKGELIFGYIGSTPVVAQNGRFHLYEGWNCDDVVLPIYTMNALGVTHCVVTNAAGALNAKYNIADIMLIGDHLNFQGVHPLSGPNDVNLGPRFPDMSDAYDKQLRQLAFETANSLGLNLQHGIYAGVHGPEFESSAERRFLTMAGGDAVGMSTIAEVIAANHVGLKVLGFSAITNSATGDENQLPDSLEEVLDNSHIAANGIRQIILKMIAENRFNT